MNNIKEPIAILGFGVEGKAALAYLEKQGMKNITVCNENENPDAFNNLSQFQTIIRSPGVYYNRPEIKEAKNAGATITSMTELALEVGKTRLTGITGSNGKTTTTALVGEILKEHYKDKIIIGGNDREPVVQRAIDNPEYPILMEVSSFQFADIQMSPHISAILNITPNHMDWHDDLDDYINAKNNLIKHQAQNDWAVLNTNDENSAKLAKSVTSHVFWVGEKKGKNWADWENDNIVVNNEVIINHKDIKIKTHPDNLIFAAAIAKIHGVPKEIIAQVMKEFSGVEHRLEFVREVNGISFYNDSSCTTPESAEVAIEQFPLGKVIIMLGGSSKKSDFGFLVAKIKNTNARVYLYGQEGEQIEKALVEAGASDQIIQHNKTKDFQTIVEDTLKHANVGDNIVLSPACASFDMFKNSKDRGKQFKEIVSKL